MIERYSSIAATSARGMELIFFPILIASLIVLNTMLGSVFERVKEIHIFSSIGLAPSHIGMLFIAEALVYAILGSVAGYLLGQFTSKILVWTHWLPDLYLNFSSVSAVMTTLIVVAVVLLSTLYPARKAAEVATPAIERTWQVPDPDGDHWIVPLPFAVTGDQASGLNCFLGEWFQAYEEYSIGDFVTQNVESEEFEHENGTRLPDQVHDLAGALRPGRFPARGHRDHAHRHAGRLRHPPAHRPGVGRHLQLEARQPSLPEHPAQAVPDLADPETGRARALPGRTRSRRRPAVPRKRDRTRLPAHRTGVEPFSRPDSVTGARSERR